jgi:tripartite-type tricarboxylate transporter receptor subunit TctC
VLVVTARAALAQPAAPAPIRLVVGYAQGGSVDLVARSIAPSLSRRLGQTVQVANVSGASGSIAAVDVALAAPDGQTLLLGSPAEIGINHLISRRSRFDPTRDLTPIGLIGSQPLVWVAASRVPVKSIDDFLAYAGKHRVRYGSSGVGTPLHLAGETLSQLAELQLVHVPYQGAAPMLADLKAGRIEFAMMVLSSALPAARDGKLRLIGITTPQSSPLAPELPSLSMHPRLRGLDASVWFGVFGPARLRPHVAARMHEALLMTLKEPETRATLEQAGVSLMEDLDLGTFVQSEIARFGKAVNSARLREEAIRNTP